MAGVYQYQDVDDSAGTDNDGDGVFVFRPEISYTPTEKDEIFAKFGFASGNGLNEISSFVFAPWAADMEDDVKDINGRNRDYLRGSIRTENQGSVFYSAQPNHC